MAKKSVNKNLQPFVKWVGGKREVIKKHLHKFVPIEFNNYIEPFLGGGAMLCWIKPKEAIINDINKELICAYKTIIKDYKTLIKKLDEYKENHSEKNFYDVRKNIPEDDIDISARFIYLNKTCFNGLYRVNSKGDFNVPFNNKKKEKLSLYNAENLKEWHNYLSKNKIKIFNKDYIKILEKANDGDFVYCDPPYDYEEGVVGFDAYNKDSFGQKNQIILANKLKELDKRNVKWMLSNHDTKLIRQLYKDYKIISISTNRMINSISNKRTNTGKEVVVVNYEQ